jgi:hypothetical protein
MQSPAGVARTGMTRFAGCTALLTALTLAGCSSSGGSSSPPSSAAPASSAAASSAPASSPAVSSSAAVSAPAQSGGATADGSTTTAVRTAYVTFFNSKTALATSQTFLQHGAVFKAALATQAKSPAAKGLSATVSKVVLQSPDLANVTFTLLGSGKPLLPDTPGYAVKEDGSWKVAAGTFCALLTLESAAPKACSDSAITALPS